ncbi:mechanosensitive ion channel family protein, partial [bacterium]|nr:mechanosensitive ion channel family protein [bacterium]
YREDVDEVIKVIEQIDETLRNDPEFMDDILEPIEILGLDQFADSAIIIKARTKTKPIKQWRIGREFNRRLKHKFDELNIEIPFPHVTFYMGEDKQSKSASLNVAIKKD